MKNVPAKAKNPWHIIALMVLAGEAIFLIPFVLPRVFRPTVLDVFNLTNVELGTCFSIYGIVAMVSYFLGGALADRFKPNILMAVALLMTAAGGIVLASYPSYFTLKMLYGYWGFTTILLFWAAMIKATRLWGGSAKQGRAFGFLEGGRGLVAVAVAIFGVLIFATFIPEDLQNATLVDRQSAFKQVIYGASGFVTLVGLLLLLFMHSKKDDTAKTEPNRSMTVWSQVGTTIQLPAVWLLMIIICCAYFGYKSTDIFSQYAKEVMLYDEVKAAKVGTLVLILRPIMGVLVGLFADRILHSKALLGGFVLMTIGASVFASGIIGPTMTAGFALSILFTAMAVYALRALYFAVMEQGKIPIHLTGTAVGLMSVAGYTPDIFAGPLMGYFLDNSTGAVGHQQVFGVLAGFAIIGGIATYIFQKRVAK